MKPYEKTKVLSLDERIAYFDNLVTTNNIPHINGKFSTTDMGKIVKLIEADGHHSGMFSHAYNVWESRKRMAARR